MLIHNVEIPQKVLDAQSEGRLVVFAGAGVSVAPPSNLPLFDELCDKISGSTDVRPKDEPIDRFIGRLKKGHRRIQTHLITRDIIGNPTSVPNGLHRNIVSLFAHSNSPKIVTTNFDVHLSTAYFEANKTQIETYHAPALPLGNDFSGIVYLHGSIAQKNPERLVLTDEDFGRAYLTEGWARRFLLELFTSDVCVLFVGYSHNDPVMQYLARGLSNPCNRFALTLNDRVEIEKWEFLDIVPITFTSYADQLSLIEKWAEFSTRSPLTHEKRVKEIVGNSPSNSPDTDSYISHCLLRIELAQYFTTHAKSPKWLEWIYNKGFITRLFQHYSDLTPVDQLLADWIARTFVRENSEALFTIIHFQGTQFHPVLWWNITLFLSGPSDELPQTDTLARWITVLVQSGNLGYNFSLLGHTLCVLRVPEDEAAALILFEYLTSPKLHLEKPIIFPGEDSSGAPYYSIEISSFGEMHHYMPQAWTKIFKPHPDIFYLKLLPIVTAHLTQAHQLLKGSGRGDKYDDTSSFNRTAIEEHSQNHLRYHLDPLIDAARDIIEWAGQNETDIAQNTIELWFRSDVPLLRRLAIHGISHLSNYLPDEKADWILDKALLFEYGVKHELYQLLLSIFPALTHQKRSEIVATVQNELEKEAEGDFDAKKRDDYRVFNLLEWLHSADSSCEMVSSILNGLTEKYPDFVKREHVDFDHWIGPTMIGYRSPKSVEEILAMDLEREFDWFLDFKQGSNWTDRDGLLRAIQQCVVKNFDWSLELVRVLTKRQLFQSDLWWHLIHGWSNSSLTDRQWEAVLTILIRHPDYSHLSEPATFMLSNSLERSSTPIPYKLFSRAYDLSRKILESDTEIPQFDVSEGSSDWLGYALNRSGGNLAMFIIKSIPIIMQEERIEKEIPEKCLSMINFFLDGRSLTAQLGSVVYCAQFSYFYSRNPEWTKSKLLPRFDWDQDPLIAQQAWDGFTFWGDWQWVFDLMLPFAEKLFDKLEKVMKSKKDVFCERLAYVAVSSNVHPKLNGWIYRFIRTTDHGSRVRWTNRFINIVKNLDTKDSEYLWNEWFNEYLQSRLSDHSTPLTNEEYSELIVSAIAFKPMFSTIVDLLVQSNCQVLDYNEIYYDIDNDDELIAKNPNEIIRLLLHILKKDTGISSQCHYLDKIGTKLLTHCNNKDLFTSFCDRLSQIGCTCAARLAEQFTQTNNGV